MRSKSIALLAALGLAASLAAPASAATVSAAPAVGQAATTSALTTAPAARKPGKPNKKWKVPVGPKFNNPMVPKDRFVIERHGDVGQPRRRADFDLIVADK